MLRWIQRVRRAAGFDHLSKWQTVKVMARYCTTHAYAYRETETTTTALADPARLPVAWGKELVPDPHGTLSLHIVQLITVPPQPWSGSCLSLSSLSSSAEDQQWPETRVYTLQTRLVSSWSAEKRGRQFWPMRLLLLPPLLARMQDDLAPVAAVMQNLAALRCCQWGRSLNAKSCHHGGGGNNSDPALPGCVWSRMWAVVLDTMSVGWGQCGDSERKKPGGAGADGERSGGGRGMSLDGEDAARRGTVVNSRPTTAEASCSWCPPASSPPGPAQHTTQTLVTIHHRQTTASPLGPAQRTTQTLVTLHCQTTASPPWSAQRTTQTLVTLHCQTTASPPWSAQRTTQTLVTLHHRQTTASPLRPAQHITQKLLTLHHRQTTASPPGPAQHTTQTLITCYHHHHLHRGLHNIHPRHLSAQPTAWTLVTHHHQTTASPLELAQPTTGTPVTRHHHATPPLPELAQPTTKTLITHHHQTTASPLELAQPTTGTPVTRHHHATPPLPELAQPTTKTLITHHHQTTASPLELAQPTTGTPVTRHHHATPPLPELAQPTTKTLITHHHQTTASPLELAQPTTGTPVTRHHHATPPLPELAQPTTKTLITHHHQTTASPVELAQPTTGTPVTRHHHATPPLPELAQPTTKTLITHHHQTTASPLEPAQEKPCSHDTSSFSSSPSYCISIGGLHNIPLRQPLHIQSPSTPPLTKAGMCWPIHSS